LERDLEMHSVFQMGSHSAKKLVSDSEIHLGGLLEIPRVIHLGLCWEIQLGRLMATQTEMHLERCLEMHLAKYWVTH